MAPPVVRRPLVAAAKSAPRNGSVRLARGCCFLRANLCAVAATANLNAFFSCLFAHLVFIYTARDVDGSKVR